MTVTRLMHKLIQSAQIFVPKIWAVVVLFILSAVATSTFAETQPLGIKPAKCIALHQGQVCYQTLKISWQADAVDDYCLVSPDRKDPWHCWNSIQAAQWELEFENANSQVFKLVRLRDLKTIGEVSVEVAWVYKSESHRESHWRVF